MNKLSTLSLMTLATFALSPLAFSHNHAQNHQIKQSVAPKSANAYIISPANGATVNETFTIKFGLKDMGVSPAGFEKKHTGHHHLLIDMDKLPPLDRPLGGDVKHFGGGQTETTLTLAKGTHTLQLILGDHRHVPHNPAVVSEKITITVK
ncbi:DUF4399 domain-containing protein [Colwellia sp. RSH04]|uniref:DUF4399 domain-containing protein n=1 Tax=Colwellia sp. RSH04 TaxID=2305464 RepID=UPI000E57390B|nr:DUF4399 domain-containing protein [Colwellia sp. RSH04]RHW76419.1 DUF4399 domain-containing protein [Colwellia sp. RSH04]